MSLFDSASVVVTPNGTKSAKFYAVKPTDGSGDLTFGRAGSAYYKRSNNSLRIANSNTVRLDYTNGICPEFLSEQAITNLFLYSEQFDQTNWAKLNCSVTANQIAPPSTVGTTGDRFITANTNTQHRLSQFINTFPTTYYTFSVFAKYDTDKLVLGVTQSSTNATCCLFDLSNGTAATPVKIGTANLCTAKIEPYINGWYRCSITVLQWVGTTASLTFSISTSDNTTSPTDASCLDVFTGTGTSGVYLWGAQLEQWGISPSVSFASSYITTTTAQVTRVADQAYKTVGTSLIGQTEGTILFDYDHTSFVNKSLWAIDIGTTLEHIRLAYTSSKNFRFVLRNTSGILNTEFFDDVVGRKRIAIGYKNGDYAIYVNGVQKAVITDSTKYPTAPLTQYMIGSSATSSYGQINDRMNLFSMWKTRLSNSELQTLSTL